MFMAIDGVSRELLEQANAGIYVEPESAIDFAEKVKYYMNQPELVIKQGQAGHQFAIENFDRTVLASKYIEALRFLKK
jgi:glycosyltransferase involved in cell wall biosynthesis